MRGLAFRRFQERKKKMWVSTHFKNHWLGGITPGQIGIRAHSPAICSCHMCGNPRKHFKQRTIQELRFLESQKIEIMNDN